MPVHADRDIDIPAPSVCPSLCLTSSSLTMQNLVADSYVRGCRMFQKFGGRWGPAPYDWGRG